MTIYLNYVTLTEQKEYSSILHNGKDDTIRLLIQAASAAVKNYLGDFSPYEGQRDSDDDYHYDSNGEPEIALDSDGSQNIKPEVKLAVLLFVDMKLSPHKYGSLPDSGNYLPEAVVQLLYPLRDPVSR